MRRKKTRRRRICTQSARPRSCSNLFGNQRINVLVIVQGLRRFSLRKIIATDPFLRAEVDLPQSILPPPSKEWEATFRNLRDSAARLVRADAGRAGTGALDDHEHRESRAARRFSGAEPQYRCRAKAGVARRTRTSKNGCAPCSNIFRRSLRSPRSSSDCKKMSRRNFPTHNGALSAFAAQSDPA